MSNLVLPPPPPTLNSLTAAQRAQLLRSTKKLGRILGITPRLLDDQVDMLSGMNFPCYHPGNTTNGVHTASPHVIELRFGDYKPPRSSHDSSDSASSSLNSYEELSGRRRTSISSRSSSWSMRSSSSRYIEGYPGHKKLPLLRLATSSPLIFESLASSTSDEDDDSDHTRRDLLRPIPEHISSSLPAFTIPTSGSARRQKMDRLRRKLGDGVPLELVFRTDTDMSSHEAPQAKTVTESALQDKPAARIPTPTPRPQTGRAIAATRDSVALPTSPHRAHRIKRKPVPKLVASRPAPPPPTATADAGAAKTAGLKPKHKKSRYRLKDKTRLSLIIESPDEHGVSFLNLEEMNVHLLSGRWSTESGYAGDSEPSPSPL
jgi:hypothetical protein